METANEAGIQESGIILWDLSRCKDNSGLFSSVERLLPSATVGYANHSSALPTLNRFICLTCINPLNCFLLTHADWRGISPAPTTLHLPSCKNLEKKSVLVAQSCLTLLRPHGLKAPLSVGILQARILDQIAMPSPPGDLPNPRIEYESPALQVDSLLSGPPGKSCKNLLWAQMRSPTSYMEGHMTSIKGVPSQSLTLSTCSLWDFFPAWPRGLLCSFLFWSFHPGALLPFLQPAFLDWCLLP